MKITDDNKIVAVASMEHEDESVDTDSDRVDGEEIAQEDVQNKDNTEEQEAF